MKNIFIIIGRVIAVLFVIFTIIIMIMAFKNIDNAFTLGLIKFYLVLLYLFIIYIIIAIFIKIRSLKWKKISKLLLRWFIWSIVLWISIVLVTYLIKGELRLTDKIFGSIIIAFGSTFGGLIFENGDND